MTPLFELLRSVLPGPLYRSGSYDSASGSAWPYLWVWVVFGLVGLSGRGTLAGAAGFAQAGLAVERQRSSATAEVPRILSAADWASIRAAHERRIHAALPAADGMSLRADNPAQQWCTTFDGRGFTAEPNAGGWQWGLELRRYGFGGSEQTVEGQVAGITSEANRVTYERDAHLQEWFINDRRGLEHGFTLRERPAMNRRDEGTAVLRFELRVRGDLRPEIAADGQGVRFVDATGTAAVNYTGLKVWDADQRFLGARFVAVNGGLRLEVDERGARYPLTVDPVAQQAYLKASNTGALDYFGQSVAISGDTVVVGAARESSSATGVNGNGADNSAFNAGAAYVFVRSGATWAQQAYLKASNTGANDLFGEAVAISGDTIVVGAPTEDSNATGVNGTGTDPRNNYESGAAYVFVRSGTNWTQQAYLKASNTGEGDLFGNAVAVSGDTVVVCARGEASSAAGVNGNGADNSAFNSGAAYVFVRNATTWSQQAYLKASNPSISDFFGSSVAVSGDAIVVGAYFEDSNATGVNGSQTNDTAADSGAAYVFVRSGTNWSQQAYLKASNTDINDRFGSGVAVSGDTIVVGAYFEDSNAVGINGNQADNSATDAGAAYVFTRTGANWSQQAYVKASDTFARAWLGIAVSVSGDTLAAGAYGADVAYVFGRVGGVWAQQHRLKADNAGFAGTADYFGIAVGVSEGSVVVGASQEDSDATGVNGDGSNNNANQAGAAYVFVVTPDLPEIVVEQPTGTALTDGSASIDFGNVIAGQSGQPLSFTVRNTGTANLTGLAVTKDGPNAADFVLNTAGLSAALAPGAQGTFTVAFAPGATGVRTAAIHIANNDADESPFDINLAGLGGKPDAPAIVVEQPAGTALSNGGATVSFGRVLSGGSRNRVFRIRNTGALELTGVSVSLTGSQAGDYAILTPPGSNVAPNSYEEFTVRFTPSATDARTAALTITSNDPEQNPFLVGLTGTGATPLEVAQQAYVKASNTGAEDTLGYAVAVSGDTVVVGAPFEDSSAAGVNGNQADDNASNSGAVYVFVRQGTNWTQQAYLKASNPDADDSFGVRVAISGDTVVVGAPFEDSSASGVNSDPSDNSAPDAGAVYVYARNGTNWIQQAYLKASNTGAGDGFGFAVGVSGDTLVVGAQFEASDATGVNGNQNSDDAFGSGATYVFVRSGATWSQQAYLKASNTDPADSFGAAVAVSGDTIVVGANYEASSATGVNGNQADNSAYAAGAAYVFVHTATTWSQQAYLKASNSRESAGFGVSVAVSGDTLVVGADGESSSGSEVNGDQIDTSSPGAGAAYVFVRSGVAWSQQAYLKAPNTDASDGFGCAVAVAGDTAVIGASNESSSATGVNGNQSDNSAGQAGAAYVFVRSGSTWSAQAYLKAPNTGLGDRFGASVGIAGNTIVAGGPYEASSATGLNGDGGDDSAMAAGAAYVFVLPQAAPRVTLSARLESGEVVLTWPKVTPAYRAETSPAISPAAWSPAPGTPVENGNTITLRLPISSGPAFFRLRSP